MNTVREIAENDRVKLRC